MGRSTFRGLIRAFFLLLLIAAAPVAAVAQITEFAIPTAGSEPHGITLGPDGALWFTEFQANKSGRITTSGSITEFAIPPSSSGTTCPYRITTGPDMVIWFTE